MEANYKLLCHSDLCTPLRYPIVQSLEPLDPPEKKSETHITMAIYDMARLGKTTVNLGNPPCQCWIITKQPHGYAIHAKTSKEIIHATQYMQGKTVVVAGFNVLQEFSKKNCKCPRVGEREREKVRAPKMN